jgi:hypothetical protein
MQYKILTSRSASQLSATVQDYLEQGWTLQGSHGVVETHRQNRFSGMQHKDTTIELEYSQTIINKNVIIKWPSII